MPQVLRNPSSGQLLNKSLRPSIYLVFAVRGREGHILPGGSHEPNVGREPSFSPNFRRYRAVQWGPLDWDD